ncbi:hypothetical protein ACIQU5_14520 [Streptomyces sp. NPDC090306]|uniref:hypothetical protein n=1 Tax=Streptomyces sp. NPDC090306 TaxID=3365961 RepID=UPI00380F6CF8
MTALSPYRVVEHAPVLSFHWEVHGTDDAPLWVGSGSCPLCGCAMTVTIGYVQPPIPKGGFLGRRKTPDSPVWYTSCRCESLHIPRPAHVPAGCGAMLRLARPGAGNGS